MNFRQRHPYLFWQLVGWGLMLADFAFLVVAALCGFGEWCYPIIVFTGLFALMAVIASPFIVHTVYKKAVPQNTQLYTEKLIRNKIDAILTARGIGHPVLAATCAFVSIFVFIFAGYLLGEYVHLALGFVLVALSVASPFIVLGPYSVARTKKFFTVKNGEKRIDFDYAADLKLLCKKDTRALVIVGEPDAVLLNFFYNWLKPYLRTERLALYKIPAPDLCRDFRPINLLQYENVLLCIPEEQLDILTEEKLMLFMKECDIMGAFPFSFYVTDGEETAM